jgi:hypothetical protein
MATDSNIAAVANKVTVAGGGTTFLLGGLTANDIAMFGGLAITIVSVLIQVFYKRRSDARARRSEKREAEEHAARMKVLRKEAGNG